MGQPWQGWCWLSVTNTDTGRERLFLNPYPIAQERLANLQYCGIDFSYYIEFIGCKSAYPKRLEGWGGY